MKLWLLLGFFLLWGNPANALSSVSSHRAPIQRVQADHGSYFSVTTDILVSGTAETPLFLFVNLSTNTLKAYINSFEYSNLSGVPAVSSAFRSYRGPTVTSNGTTLTAVNNNSGSATTSKMHTFKSPTISANGTLTSLRVASGLTYIHEFDQGVIIMPASTLLITVTNSGSNGSSAVNCTWSEE